MRDLTTLANCFLRVLVLVGITCLMPLTVSAQDGMGPLTPLLPQTQTDGTWTYQSGNGLFQMTNPETGGALQYYYVSPQSGEEGRRSITVNVTVEQGNDQSGAGGLIYGLDRQAGRYFLFVIEAGNQVSFIRRDSEGFNPMMQVQSDAIVPGQNQLTLTENGTAVSLIVNGKVLGEIGTTGTGSGAAGIVAAGIVRATFGGFAVTLN